jgi:hypothetical protein
MADRDAAADGRGLHVRRDENETPGRMASGTAKDRKVTIRPPTLLSRQLNGSASPSVTVQASALLDDLMNTRNLLPPPGKAFLASVLLTASVHAQYSTAVLADEPVGYYPLGDAPPSESVAFNSGSAGASLDGSHLRVGHQVDGAILASSNKASFYDGTARTLIPYNAALNPPAAQPFTIEAWIMPTIEGLANAQAPLFNRHSTSPRQGWVFFQRASAEGTPGSDGSGWNFRMYAESGTSTSINLTGGSYLVGVWSHVVVTWDGSTARLYVDGALAGQQTGGYVANSDVPLGIGSYSANNPGDNPFTGNVDEVAFYPSALTDVQILEHYDNANSALPAESYASLVKGDGAVLYLPLDEPSADRVVAVNQGSLGASGNGLHFPGAVHEVPGALAADPDTAVFVEAIDKSSGDGGYPTVVPNLPEFNSASFSWEAWVRPTAEGRANAQCILKNHDPGDNRTGWVIWQRASVSGTPGGDGSGWNLRLYNGTGNNRTINITTGNGAGGYTVGQWQHLAVTYNAATQTAVFYVNGASAGTQTTTNGPYVPNPAGSGIVPSIGGFSNGTENPFEGDIDEVAFYDTVLTPSLVAAHHANGISASPAVPYAELIASDGPVGYYRMNEAAKAPLFNQGTAGSDANGTYVNVPAAIPGPISPAYPGFTVGTTANEFRGSATHVELKNPAALDFGGPITLEAWVQPAAAQANFSNGIICHGLNDDETAKEIYLRIENGNYEVGSATGKASAAVPAGDQGEGSWIHLAGTWSAGTWTLYRNGTATATGADATGPVTVPNANWAIGARGRWKRATGFPTAPNPGEHRAFTGGILEAAIYNKALSATQISDHFVSGAGTRTLLLTRPGGVTTLEWDGGILQQSDTLGGWADVPGAVSPHLPSDGPRHFYRLRY